jgi:hypothetical protein
MATAKIILCEADPDVRRLLVTLIERLGHEALVLGSDVVVPPHADLMLVEPDSSECLENARLMRTYFPDLPVLCFNAVPAAGRFLLRGPLGYLQKPFSIEHLRTTLQDALAISPV